MYKKVDKEEAWTKEELFEHSEKLRKQMETDKPFEKHELDFLWQSCQKEQDMGFAGEMMTKEQMDLRYGVGKWS